LLVVIGLLNYTRKSSFTLLSYLSIPTEIFIEPFFIGILETPSLFSFKDVFKTAFIVFVNVDFIKYVH